MPRKKSPQRDAAGKLVSAIQKVWSYRSGTDQSDEAFHVMERAHGLVQAAASGKLSELLGNQSVVEYLGSPWVACHPGVMSAASALEQLRREV
jgi:hypothetical protein